MTIKLRFERGRGGKFRKEGMRECFGYLCMFIGERIYVLFLSDYSKRYIVNIVKIGKL